jgi:MFS transporter, ACS family, tartrate transporter
MVPPPPGVNPRAVYRKIWWRIIPLLFFLYIVAYLDRVNVGFANLKMSPDLHFTNTEFGIGIGFFYIGYLLLEIPGAILVERWSARKWFARILITWGLCSMGTALVTKPWHFYTARFLLGLAEAGFFPGMIVFFSHWFPREVRGRALAGMILAVPMSMASGAIVSSFLLKMSLAGLKGWQWMYLIEGFPAVLFGVAVPFLLTDRPRHARWLTRDESDWLEQTLELERKEAAALGTVSLKDVVKLPMVWLLALGIFTTNVGGFTLGSWLPKEIKDILKPTHGEISDSGVLYWTAGVYLIGLAGVWLSGKSSDRAGERKWHCSLGMGLTGAFIAISMLLAGSWEVTYALLLVGGFFMFSWAPPYWVLPSQSLPPSVAPVAIGFINMCANAGGAIGPPVMGVMNDLEFTPRTAMLFPAACYLAGGLIIAMLRAPKLQRATQPAPAGSETAHV